MDQNSLTIVCISDTHCKFVELPPGDILIHCGDFSIYGKNIDSFIQWLVKQEFKHKIVIGGNHECSLDIRSPEFDKELKEKQNCCHYLENSSVILEGYKFWGSPYTLGSAPHAFPLNKNEAPALWKYIENDAQFVLTHEPPHSYGDKLNYFFFNHVGDKALLEAIRKIKPKYHIFGHVHEAYGIYEGKNKEKGIKFINCSINDRKNEIIHAPIIIKVPIIK